MTNLHVRNTSRRLALRREGGAAAVEFALVAALLFLLLFGIVEFARFMSISTALETASREAARYGSAVGVGPNGVPRYADCAEIRAAGRRLSGLASLQNGNIAVTFDNGAAAVKATCPASGSINPATIVSGDRIVVTSTASFTSPVPFLDGISLSATERRTIFKP